MRAEARDDVFVESVQFLVNGQPVFTDYAPPYEYTLQVPTGTAPQMKVGAVATDLAGNRGAQEIPVTVTPRSAAPAVSLLAPVPGQKVIEGTLLTLAAQASDDNAVSKVQFRVNGQWYDVSNPPYRWWVRAPGRGAQLSITAVAYDADGPSQPTDPVVLTVLADEPPTATVLAPSDGAQVVEGSWIDVLAGATDDLGVRTVEIYVDGVRFFTLGTPPYEWQVSAPLAGESLHIKVVAEDTQFQRTTSPEIVVTSIPDPLTTIHGRTVDSSGIPVAGARVEAGGLLTLSGADGTFSLSGLPTNAGGLFLSASAVVGGFTLNGSLADLISPVPGGTVEIGDLVLTRDDPGATVTGQTVDEAGSPVAGATVKVYNSFSVFVTTSGADGRFTVAGVPSRKSLSISATATVDGARLRGTTDVNPAAGEVTDVGSISLLPVDEVPDPLTTVIGTVLSSNGDPAAGAKVNVFTFYDVFSTVTTADGTFSLAGIPTVDGDLSFGVSAVINGGLQSATSFGIGPSPGDVTDLGAIYLSLGGGGPVSFLLQPRPLATPGFTPRIAFHEAEPICPVRLALTRGAWGGL